MSQFTLDTIRRSLANMRPRWVRAGALYFFAMAIILGVLALTQLAGILVFDWAPLPSGWVIFVVNCALCVACASTGNWLWRVARVAGHEGIREAQVAQKTPNVLVRTLGQLPPSILRIAALLSIMFGIFLSTFAFIRLSRVLVHWDSAPDGLIAAGISLSVCVLLGALGWTLWQIAKSVERQRPSDKTPPEGVF